MAEIWTRDEEAARLAARFRPLNKDGPTQAGFSKAHDFPGGASMINQHIKGHRPMNLQHALIYAKAFGCPIGEISPRLSLEAESARKGTDYVLFVSGQPVAAIQAKTPEVLAVKEPGRPYPIQGPGTEPLAQTLTRLVPWFFRMKQDDIDVLSGLFRRMMADPTNSGYRAAIIQLLEQPVAGTETKDFAKKPQAVREIQEHDPG